MEEVKGAVDVRGELKEMLRALESEVEMISAHAQRILDSLIHPIYSDNDEDLEVFLQDYDELDRIFQRLVWIRLGSERAEGVEESIREALKENN